MANILDLRTIGNQTIYVVDDVPSAVAGTAAYASSLALYPEQVAATGSFTVVDYTQAGSITLTVGSTNFVEGVDWTAATDNPTTAGSIASAINTAAIGVSALAVGAVVNITAVVGIPSPTGPEGNSIALVTTNSGAVSVSGANLTGGRDWTIVC